MRIGWRQLLSNLSKKKSDFYSVGIEFGVKSLHLSAFKLVDGQPTWVLQHQLTVEDWAKGLKAWVEEHGLTNTLCNVAFSINKYKILAADKPAVPDEELAQALRWSIKDLLPTQEEVVIDYFNQPAQTMGADKVNVVAIPRAEIVEIVQGVQKAGLSLESIAIEELVTCDLLPYSEDAVITVLQEPGQEVCLNIVKGGKLYFARRLKGYEQLSTFSEDEIKMGIGDNLSIEIQRSMDYFEGQLRQAGAKRIYLAMDTQHQQTLADMVKQLTLLDVEPFFPDIQKLDELKFENVHYTCLGAGLCHTQQSLQQEPAA